MNATLKTERCPSSSPNSSVLRWLCLFPILGAITMAQATPIGWYRMEGISGNQISTVTNSIGGGGAAPDANASGTAFNYSSVVAGAHGSSAGMGSNFGFFLFPLERIVGEQ